RQRRADTMRVAALRLTSNNRPQTKMILPILLKDSYGRAIRDLRISITDRCNFRCFYCMPTEAMEWKPKPEILTYEEIIQLAELFVSLGITKLRVTGGE